MNTNHRRNTNTIQCGRMLTWFVLIGVICVWALSIVAVKNRIHGLGSERVTLEKQLKSLQEETGVVHAQVAQWSSHQQLQKRMDEGFIQLLPIADERLVRLHLETERPILDGLRAVSNKVGVR